MSDAGRLRRVKLRYSDCFRWHKMAGDYVGIVSGVGENPDSSALAYGRTALTLKQVSDDAYSRNIWPSESNQVAGFPGASELYGAHRE